MPARRPIPFHWQGWSTRMVHGDGRGQLELFPAMPSVKRCSSCGEQKPHSEFHRKSAASDGLQSRCRACNIASAKQFHADNAEHCRERIAEWMGRVNQANKRRVLEHLLANPCVDCGETDPVVLEFDHRRDKVAAIGELLQRHVSWRVIAAEIAKCEVRCANCHRRRTAAEGQWFRVVERWAAWGSNPEPTS